MKRLILLALALVATFAVASCSKSTNTNTTNANNKNAISNTTGTNTSSSTSTSSTALDSPTAAYKAAYEAAKKKDVAGVKATLSKAAMTEFEKLAQAENKSVDEVIKEGMDDPEEALPNTIEVRNEKIDGDKATLECKDAKGAWEKVSFVKEGGSWKLDISAAREIEGEKNVRG